MQWNESYQSTWSVDNYKLKTVSPYFIQYYVATFVKYLRPLGLHIGVDFGAARACAPQ